MRSLILWLLSTVAALAIWTALVVIGSLYGWWQESLAPDGDARAFMDAAVAEIDERHHGNVAFVLIENRRIFEEYYTSVGARIDRDTLFQVSSLSKWITAYGVMTLVEAGDIDLDAPVSTYLKRWSLPDSEYDNGGVTVRRLLSHTAGLTDGLGFAGFAPGTDVQTLEEALTNPNSSPGHEGRIRVGYPPGTEWQYSGGGYLLLQLLIEEVSGTTFEAYMQRAVFDPLGMSRSTYALEDGSSNLAVSYDVDGTPGILYRFTALAATSLYTTAADMARFIQAHLAHVSQPSRRSRPSRQEALKPETLKLMRQPHGSAMGADIWGLGTMLYAPNGDDDFVVGHDGRNEPAINTTVRVNPATGDGIVILETGNLLLASTLAGEWVFWQTGRIDVLMIVIGAEDMIKVVIAGWAAVLLAGLLIGWRMRRRPI
ncbi:MAG: serine hydrolase [Gammaproteobacteria bacterium]|nr:serine hydrolase [Gammaproteobacteria bacterium]